MLGGGGTAAAGAAAAAAAGVAADCFSWLCWLSEVVPCATFCIFTPQINHMTHSLASLVEPRTAGEAHTVTHSDTLRDCATAGPRERTGRRHSRKLIPAIFIMADDGESSPRYHLSRLAAASRITTIAHPSAPRDGARVSDVRRTVARRHPRYVWRETSTSYRGPIANHEKIIER